MPVKVVTDSTSYIPLNLREKLDISVVSLNVSFGLESFKEEEIDNSTFYKRIEQSNTIPTSSQPTPSDMYKAFEKPVRDGNAVVGIFISSEMSGTYSTAQMVKNKIKETYSEAVIELIDSRSNCMELGLAVITAARAAREGKELREVAAAARSVAGRSRFMFVPDGLHYLKKGGRIGGASALLGSVLQIRPILTVSDGKTAVLSKVRTRARAINTMVEQMQEDIKNKVLGQVIVHHINNEPGGEKLAKALEDKLSVNVPVLPIGPVIGLHVGPGTLGIVYCIEA